jgi:hypothetical protein
MSGVLALKHKRHSAHPVARQQQQQLQQQLPQQASLAAASSTVHAVASGADAPQVLRRLCPLFKGWKQQLQPASNASTSPESCGKKVSYGHWAWALGSLLSIASAYSPGNAHPHAHVTTPWHMYESLQDMSCHSLIWPITEQL